MASSCIPILTTGRSLACLGAGIPVGTVGCSQSAHHRSVTARLSFRSIFSGSIKRKSSVAGIHFFSTGSGAARCSGIDAWAVELEGTKDEILSSADDSSPSATPDRTPTSKLYVGNLAWSVDSKQVAEVFQECGDVELVEVIYDRDTQRSRGFAFVTMRTVEDAEKAIATLDGYELEGRSLRVNLPQSGKPDGPRPPRNDRAPRREGSGNFNKIFVGNLSWGVDDVALAELFSEYGQVAEAKVVYDRESGRSRGFAFVTMSRETEVDMAVQALDGAEFDGRILRVNQAGDMPQRRDTPRREY